MTEAKPARRVSAGKAGREGAGQVKPARSPRDRILASAEKLFGEAGFDGASVRQIALAADVPLALVSYHFGSKEGLYRAIFELRTPTIADSALQAFSSPSWRRIRTAGWNWWSRH